MSEVPAALAPTKAADRYEMSPQNRLCCGCLGRHKVQTYRHFIGSGSLSGRLGVPSAALFLGGMIYVLWRSDSLLMFHWFEHLGLAEPVLTMRLFAAPYSGSFPSWFYFALPNGLWLLSGILFLHCVWGSRALWQPAIWASILSLIAITSELCQYWGIVPGVFDGWDLFFLVSAVLVGAGCIAAYDRRGRRVRNGPKESGQASV